MTYSWRLNDVRSVNNTSLRRHPATWVSERVKTAICARIERRIVRSRGFAAISPWQGIICFSIGNPCFSLEANVTHEKAMALTVMKKQQKQQQRRDRGFRDRRHRREGKLSLLNDRSCVPQAHNSNPSARFSNRTRPMKTVDGKRE